MKKMGKRLPAILAVLTILLCGLMGCTPGTDTSTSGGSTAGLEAEKGKTLSIMIPGHNPNSTEESAWQNAVVKEFKEKYPDVNVEWVVAGWDSWYTKVIACISSNDPIDLINDGANNNPKFALKGVTQPINDYVDLTNENLHKATMDAVFCYDNKYYVAVSETNVAVVYYNKTIIENEGFQDPQELVDKGEWNWTNFTKLANSLTDTNSKRWGFATNYPYLFFGADATSMLTLDNQFRYTLNIDSPSMKNALQMIQDGWYTSNWQGWENDPWSTFYKGSAVMLGDFQWVEAQILQAQEYGLADFEFGVVPMPTGPDNTEGVSPITAAGWAIGNGSDCPNYTGKLIDMLVNGQAAYLEKQNTKLDAAHVALYKQLAQKPFCTNSYDSAVGGAFDICQAIQQGQSISQAIEEFKPIYQRKIDQANSGSLEDEE